MEESTSVTEAAATPAKDLSAEIKDCSHDTSHEFGLSVPICFLVKEQAKSFIAIQDLQNRLNRVERIQDDVIDAVIEFRNFLSDTRSICSPRRASTTNALSLTKSPQTIFSKCDEALKSDATNIPCDAESSADAPRATARSQSCSLKESGSMSNDPALVPEPPHKGNFSYFAKSRDSALESDKQDSGLDSDCRDHHPSLPPAARGGDELLQLLDEIGHRSVLLQRQLAVAPDDAPAKRGPESEPETSDTDSATPEGQRKLTSTTVFEARQLQPRVPRQDEGLFPSLDEKAAGGSDRNGRGLLPSGIDAAAVSAILKEGSLVDLQKKTLLFLLDNTLLASKVGEAERALEARRAEGERVEATLREEARLLMMENRELRISLDEQRLDSNALRSRVAVLERLLQSVHSENRELNWQLGETLNLGRPARAENHCHDAPSSSKSARKPSPQQSSRADASVHCVKSKLLSDNSSFLDITVDDPDETRPRPPSRPIYSSTPMFAVRKQQELKSVLNSSYAPPDRSDFQSVKKCLQSSYDSDGAESAAPVKPPQPRRVAGKTFSEGYSEIRNRKSQGGAAEGVEKFPFNTILEKLKANSECRLSKSTSAKTPDCAGDGQDLRSRVAKSGEGAQASWTKDAVSSSRVSPEVALQRRKGRDIQQRIQNILDRIVQSEEGS